MISRKSTKINKKTAKRQSVLWEDASSFNYKYPKTELPLKKTVGEFLGRKGDFLLIKNTKTFDFDKKNRKFSSEPSSEHNFFLIPLGMVKKGILKKL